MSNYKVLNKQIYTNGEYSLVPIRQEDKYDIMKWRNEQMYHLRQATPLTEESQEQYFNSTIAALFEKDLPDQILFSYLKNGSCVGYGGLVHINWIDKNAEISFIMDTQLEDAEFELHWCTYLKMLEELAFKDLNLHKIYTYAFDLRPHLYHAIEKVGFTREATLKEHCFFYKEYKDVVIHSKCNNIYKLRLINATEKDAKTYLNWANDEAVRKASFNEKPILWEDHVVWFKERLNDPLSHLYICYLENMAIGQVRFDQRDDGWHIDYSIDNKYRGKKLSTPMLDLAIQKLSSIYSTTLNIVGEVKYINKSSASVFHKLHFIQKEQNKDFITFNKVIHV